MSGRFNLKPLKPLKPLWICHWAWLLCNSTGLYKCYWLDTYCWSSCPFIVLTDRFSNNCRPIQLSPHSHSTIIISQRVCACLYFSPSNTFWHTNCVLVNLLNKVPSSIVVFIVSVGSFPFLEFIVTQIVKRSQTAEYCRTLYYTLLKVTKARRQGLSSGEV